MLRRRSKHEAPPSTPAPAAPRPPRFDVDLTGLTAPATPEPRRGPLRAAPDASAEIEAVVTETVGRVLANALVEVQVEPGALQGLREQGAAARLLEAIDRIDQQTAQIDGMARQLQALTNAVVELSDATRALLRHQWDNMPPQSFWSRVQRADDELRRSLDDLAAEVRGRAPRSNR